jgi:cytochrome P450
MTGTETIQSFTPRLVALAVDTGWMDRLLLAGPDDALRGRVVEEALRVTVPTPAMLRSVRSAHHVGAVPVRAGERVVIATVTCCRAGGAFDPARDADPALRNLWFGAGPHFCLGMPLAMAQVGAVLDALRPVAAAGRPLRVAGREVARGVLIPSYRRLRIEAAASSSVWVEEAP